MNELLKELVELKNNMMTETVLINSDNQNDDNVNLKEVLNDLEYRFIKIALDSSHGIVSHAAEKLGMRRTTFIEKMKKYQINK